MCKVTEPAQYFGAEIGRYTMDIGELAWYMPVQQYLKKAFIVKKANFGKKFKTMCSMSKQDLLMSTDYHPELDNTEYLAINNICLYQSYIGIIR